MKALLKRTVGGLKKAVVLAPIILFFGGVATFMGSGITGAVKDDKIREFKRSQPVTNEVTLYETHFNFEKAEQIYKAKTELASGELTVDDYILRMTEINNEKLPERDEIINKIFANDEYYQGLLKSEEDSKIALAVGGGVAVAGVLGVAAEFIGERSISDRLLDSAEWDFREAKKIEKEKKKKQKALEDEEEKE